MVLIQWVEPDVIATSEFHLVYLVVYRYSFQILNSGYCFSNLFYEGVSGVVADTFTSSYHLTRILIQVFCWHYYHLQNKSRANSLSKALLDFCSISQFFSIH